MERLRDRIIKHLAITGIVGLGIASLTLEKEQPVKTQFVPHLSETTLIEVGYFKSPILPETIPSKIKEQESISPVKKLFTVADTMVALRNALPRVACTISFESGGGGNGYTPYDPNIISKEGYLGIGQFAEGGKLREFYTLGYSDWRNPHEVVDYMNDAFRRNQQYHWGPVTLGLC